MRASLFDFVAIELDARSHGYFDDANRVRNAVAALLAGQLTVSDIMGGNGREGYRRVRLHEGSTDEVMP